VAHSNNIISKKFINYRCRLLLHYFYDKMIERKNNYFGLGKIKDIKCGLLNFNGSRGLRNIIEKVFNKFRIEETINIYIDKDLNLFSTFIRINIKKVIFFISHFLK
jgi:hypothetical protein